MSAKHRAALLVLAAAGLAAAFAQPAPAQEAPLLVLAPKAKPAGWTGVHRPHTKLVDVLARHKGQANWAETVVDDESLTAQWISLAPGGKTPRRMNGDTREWWIVQSGTLRFTVEGRDPVVATKGFMVQVPYRTLYQIENVGSEPALRFEVNVTRARKLYPMDETPVPLPGFDYIPTKVTGGKGELDAENRAVVDFSKVVSGTERAGPFVSDDRAFANIILGNYQRPKTTDKGHFHEEGSEFWLIMLGSVRYKIEGLEEFEAEPGDVVYAPRQTWHLASNGGEPGLRSCRLAMNGFPSQAHLWETD
jgi:mannose-6-phosphate isomerase-like protein (cupin superfamily)